MQILFESELMKNQKHAQVMVPEARFEVLQTQQGSSLFFSLGTDGVFYLTQEMNGTKTGWTKQDLSSALAQQLGGNAVTIRAFDVSQDPQSGAIDLALAVTAGGTDHLFLSRGNSNADAAWAKGVSWTAVPYDEPAQPMPALQIADIDILQVSGAEYFVVDILKRPGDPLQQLLRFYITPGSGVQHWHIHALGAEFSAGSLSSVLGQRYVNDVAGIYTFGTIGSTTQLIYTPLWNDFNPKVPPSPVVLTPPGHASAIATSLRPDGRSNLFVAGDQTLWLFTPESLTSGASGSPIVTNAVIAGVQQLRAVSSAGATEVWGVSQQGTLFYTRCPIGAEAQAQAWSHPLPILRNVQRIAPFLNNADGGAVLFAHVGGSELMQLTKDPITGAWQQRSILLPPTALNDMIEYQSFTTHIRVTDDNNIAQPDVKLAVTATSKVSIYANDVYYLLSPDVAIMLATDASGVLTVIQQTHTIAAVCLKVTPQPATASMSAAAPSSINPMAKINAKLGTVQSADDLGSARFANADGSQSPLLPAGTGADQQSATADAIKQFGKMSQTLPQDGSVQPAARAGAVSLRQRRVQAGDPAVWGLSFAAGGWRYHQDDAAIAFFALDHDPSGAIRLNGQSTIAVGWGDFVAWITSVWDDVASFVVHTADDVYYFIVTVGNDIYNLVIDCIHAVVQAVEFVFNKIRVFFDNLAKWLGFLFQWADILRTHKVVKNILKGTSKNPLSRRGCNEIHWP